MYVNVDKTGNSIKTNAQPSKPAVSQKPSVNIAKVKSPATSPNHTQQNEAADRGLYENSGAAAGSLTAPTFREKLAHARARKYGTCADQSVADVEQTTPLRHTDVDVDETCQALSVKEARLRYESECQQRERNKTTKTSQPGELLRQLSERRQLDDVNEGNAYVVDDRHTDANGSHEPNTRTQDNDTEKLATSKLEMHDVELPLKPAKTGCSNNRLVIPFVIAFAIILIVVTLLCSAYFVTKCGSASVVVTDTADTGCDCNATHTHADLQYDTVRQARVSGGVIKEYGSRRTFAQAHAQCQDWHAKAHLVSAAQYNVIAGNAIEHSFRCGNDTTGTSWLQAQELQLKPSEILNTVTTGPVTSDVTSTPSNKNKNCQSTITKQPCSDELCFICFLSDDDIDE